MRGVYFDNGQLEIRIFDDSVRIGITDDDTKRTSYAFPSSKDLNEIVQTLTMIRDKIIPPVPHVTQDFL